MAGKADIQYVHPYYTSGTAAKKVAVKAPRKKKPLPIFEPLMTAQPEEKIIVKLDPLSLCAIAVCAVLVAMMVVSLFQYSAAYHRNVELQEYVYTLEDDNLLLERDFRAGLDLEDVRLQASALGMIPAEEAAVIQVAGRVPAAATEPTRWERLQLFLGELFA